jgi:branched-chain amino acid aminotransferase
MVDKAEKIWMDGKLVNWDDANVHILTHTLHYGMGVFEGIRAYKCTDGRSAIFRLKEHVDRLFDSAHIGLIPLPYSREQVAEAIVDTLKANNQAEAYIRPIVFIGDGEMGIFVSNIKTHVFIVTWAWGAYLGTEGLNNGIRCKISSFSRHHVNAAMSKAKVCGNYANSILAKREVVMAGYDEAILLDTDGYVAEGSGENIFIVEKGIIKTTPLTSVLAGITRDSVMKIAKDLGIEVIEERFTRDELYIADEVFFSGTAAELTPIREVDNRTIGTGKPGPITKKIQETFFRAVKGEEKKYEDWLAYY